MEMSKALKDVLAERKRQEKKGFDANHDDEHVNGEIALAASDWITPGQQPNTWSWAAHKATRDRRTQLIIGVAMALAELERVDRAAQCPPFKIVTRSVEGLDSVQYGADSDSALKLAKASRTEENRMVKIFNAGSLNHRWDRTHVIGENRWKKENPGEVEILGNPAPIQVIRQARKSI